MKFITFDVTNTLIKVASGVGQQYNKILMQSKLNSIRLDNDLTNRMFSRLFKEQNIKYPGYGYSQGMSSRTWWSIITKEIIHENAKQQGIANKLCEDDIEVATNLIFDEFCQQKYWQRYKNCGKLLKDLKDSNYRIGVISNFDERIYKILDTMRLLEYFDFIKIPSNSDGFAKPSQEMFLQAIELAKKKYGQREKHDFLHIGDNVELDYRASRACGYDSILMCHENACYGIFGKLEKDDEIKNEANHAINLLDLKEKISFKFNGK